MLPVLKFNLNEKTYLKDPESTILGRKILQQSILLIDEVGFENFTFKKLGEQIGSNESSIYRYFDNKHKLLVYLSSWYWSWIFYRMQLINLNISDTKECLIRAIGVVTEKIEDDITTDYINESVLNRIIISEFTKTLLTKEVDNENKEGFFYVYKQVVNHLVGLIKQVNPDYLYAKSLASSVVQGALHQHFLKEHLTSITNCNNEVSPGDFYINMLHSLLK
jgi:AcrR family transcriptional regulator